MESFLQRYLSQHGITGDLIRPGSPVYAKALELAGVMDGSNHHTYMYGLVEMRLVKGANQYCVMHLIGGRGNRGRWDEYLHMQQRLIQSAIRAFGDAWVCFEENDPKIDEHSLIIGVDYDKELEIKNEKNKPTTLSAYADEPDFSAYCTRGTVSGQPVSTRI